MRQTKERPAQEQLAPEKKEKRRGGFLLVLAVLCLMTVVLLSVMERQVQISEKRQELVQLQTQLEAQSQKNQKLRHSLDDADGLGEYAEHRARVELDYAKPNERVFIDMGGE